MDQCLVVVLFAVADLSILENKRYVPLQAKDEDDWPDYHTDYSGWSDVSPVQRVRSSHESITEDINEGSVSDVSDDDAESVASEVDAPDYARPIELHIFDDRRDNLYAIDFLRDNTIGNVTRRHTVKMWKLFIKYFCQDQPISYDTLERRVFRLLPEISIAWKVQNLQTKKYFTGRGVSFPEKAYGDRETYETLVVWARMKLRDVIRLHAGAHEGVCNFVEDGIIQYDKVHVTITYDGIPYASSSPDNLNVMAIRFRNCKLVYILQTRYGKRHEPKDVHEFMDEFVLEASELRVKVDYFLADAPMRSFIKCLKGHAGRHSCETCEARGVCVNRKIVYPASMVLQRRRTMERWLECVADLEEQRKAPARGQQTSNVKGITGRSPLLSLPEFDIVRKAPTDPLHRDWLGLTKAFWKATVGVSKTGHISARGSRISSTVSDFYKAVRLPKEFSHRSRAIDIPHMKAHEWKSILVTSFTCICETVNAEVGHELARIWCTFAFLILLYYGPEWICYGFELEELEQLHQRLYDDYEMEFGQAACTYNFHAFYHMPVVRRLGRAHHVSTEPFESAYGQVKNSFQAGTRNIALQIVRNMMLKNLNHTSAHCKHALFLETERTKVRFDNSIVIDDQLTYYRIKRVNDNSVDVVVMNTEEWICPWDDTLPFNRVGVRRFITNGTTMLNLDNSQLMGKGTLLPNGLLVPFYWDMLFS